MQSDRRPISPARDTATILLIGLVLRLGWMILARAAYQPLDLGEASHASLAFARGDGIADAFHAGQGPTAHLLPVMIWIAGTIHRLLGPDSAAANLTLAAWALAQTFAGYLVLRSLFLAIGIDRRAARGGLILMCALPIFAPQESCDFRVWEGGLAVCLAAANLWWIVVLTERGAASWRDLAGAAALAAATAFTSPAAGLAVDCCWAVFAIRNLPVARIAGFAAMAAAALAILFVPWALRNLSMLGEAVWVRSDLGLEMAIADHPAAVPGSMPAAVLQARVAAIHPFGNPGAIAAMRAAGGEIAYSRMLDHETWAWAASDPLGFARLTVRHYRQFYVPDAWMMKLTNWPDLVVERAVAMRLVCVSGLIALLLGLCRRRRHFGLLATYAAAVGLPYALVQPIPRYSYLVYGVLCYLAASLLFELTTALASGRGPHGQPTPPVSP